MTRWSFLPTNRSIDTRLELSNRWIGLIPFGLGNSSRLHLANQEAARRHHAEVIAGEAPRLECLILELNGHKPKSNQQAPCRGRNIYPAYPLPWWVPVAGDV